MTPAKIKEHEPTAVKREMTEKIGKTGTDAQEAADLARKKGMAKGTAGASETRQRIRARCRSWNRTDK